MGAQVTRIRAQCQLWGQFCSQVCRHKSFLYKMDYCIYTAEQQQPALGDSLIDLPEYTHKFDVIQSPFWTQGWREQVVFSYSWTAQTTQRIMVPYFPVLNWRKKVLATNLRLTLLSSVQIFPSFRPQTSEIGLLIFLSLLFENLRQSFRHANVRTSQTILIPEGTRWGFLNCFSNRHNYLLLEANHFHSAPDTEKGAEPTYFKIGWSDAVQVLNKNPKQPYKPGCL